VTEPLTYAVHICRTRAELEAARGPWREFLADGSVDAGVFCDPEAVDQLVCFEGGDRVALAEAFRGGARVALLPFELKPIPLPLAIGLWQLAVVRPLTLRLFNFDFATREPAARMRLLAGALDALKGAVACDLVLVSNCVLENAARTAPAGFPRGAVIRGVQPTYMIDMPASFGEYVSGLSRTTRQNYRWKVGRMRRECGGTMILKRYGAPDAMDELYAHMMAVWERSWKGRLSAYAPADAAFLKRMARGGWVRSYVLFVGDTPVAYVQGYQYRARYVRERSGYDAAWQKYSPGGVLTWMIMEDLFSSDAPRVVDFDFGYNEYKKILGTREQVRGELWAPSSAKGSRVLVARRFCDGIYRAGKAAVGRLGVIEGLKRRMKKGARNAPGRNR